METDKTVLDRAGVIEVSDTIAEGEENLDSSRSRSNASPLFARLTSSHPKSNLAYPLPHPMRRALTEKGDGSGRWVRRSGGIGWFGSVKRTKC